MTSIIVFLIFMKIFLLTDCIKLTIPNLIVLPAILIGCVMTGNWQAAVIMFCLGALLFNRTKLAGGDVKLLAMAGAFLGLKALPAFLLSKIFIYLYRRLRKEIKPLPYTPFLYVASLPFVIWH